MKQLNGEPIVRFGILAYFECTLEEADRILVAKENEAIELFLALLHSKRPVNERCYDHQLKDFRDDVGRSLVAARERQLKQLPAPEVL